jgi:NAD+ synthase (glutamine-hydrolysing)
MDKNILFYTQKIDNDLANDCLTEQERVEIADNLKKLISKQSVVLAQVNPVCGDIEYNTKKALKWIEWANRLSVSAIFFPELYLFGAPLGDYIDKFSFIVDEAREWLDVLAAKTKETKVFIGYVERNDSQIGRKYYNSVAVLCNGKVERIIRKSVFSDYSQYKDYNKFLSGLFDISERCFSLDTCNVGVVIGEEIFSGSDYDLALSSSPNFIEKLTNDNKIDLIVNLTSSITRLDKNVIQHSKLSNFAKNLNKKIVSVNQVGAAGNVVFDGGSSVYNENGEVIYRAKSFEEQFFVVDFDLQEGQIYKSQSSLDTLSVVKNTFSLDYENDLERIYLTMVNSVKDYFKKQVLKEQFWVCQGGWILLLAQ